MNLSANCNSTGQWQQSTHPNNNNGKWKIGVPRRQPDTTIRTGDFERHSDRDRVDCREETSWEIIVSKFTFALSQGKRGENTISHINKH